ncbi:MAG: hypothetical protein AAGE92_10095, partial [Cyanobacteria bacterium P01_G01_bin.4]
CDPGKNIAMRVATSDVSAVVNQNRGTRKHPSSGCQTRTEPNPTPRQQVATGTNSDVSEFAT